MLGRRQLRAKAMQALYAYYRGNRDLKLVERNMIKGVYDVENLYHALLTLIVSLKTEAEEKIEIGLAKNFPTEQEKNPNRRFVHNKVIQILEQNELLQDFSSKNKQLDWKTEDIYPNRILKDLTEDEKFEEYMSASTPSFEADKDIIMYIFANYIAPNEDILDFLGDKNLNWTDDLHIANTMVMNTIKQFKENEQNKLFKLLLDEEHLDFTKELVRVAVRHEDELTQIIEQKAKNWDFDRIALIDRLILQMALAEFLHFPSIPPKVTLNEYVEMSKTYSTPKSKTFVNGILDKSLKDLEAEGKIRKSARGLM